MRVQRGSLSPDPTAENNTRRRSINSAGIQVLARALFRFKNGALPVNGDPKGVAPRPKQAYPPTYLIRLLSSEATCGTRASNRREVPAVFEGVIALRIWRPAVS
jgi:hypothetical protein